MHIFMLLVLTSSVTTDLHATHILTPLFRTITAWFREAKVNNSSQIEWELQTDMRHLNHGGESTYYEMNCFREFTTHLETKDGTHQDCILKLLRPVRLRDRKEVRNDADASIREFLKKGEGSRAVNGVLHEASGGVAFDVETNPSSSHHARTRRMEELIRGKLQQATALKNVVSSVDMEEGSNDAVDVSALRMNQHHRVKREDYIGDLPIEIEYFLAYKKDPAPFQHFRLDGFGSILLYGEPGTGKTYLAEMLATEANSLFIAMSPEQLIDSYIGQSPENVRTLFDTVYEAAEKENSSAIIYLDEFDSAGKDRADQSSSERHAFVAQFLQCMDGSGKKYTDRITVIATTNLPLVLDQAFGRRFQTKIELFAPNDEALFALLVLYGAKHHYEPAKVISLLAREKQQQIAKNKNPELSSSERDAVEEMRTLLLKMRGVTPDFVKTIFQKAGFAAGFRKLEVIPKSILDEVIAKERPLFDQDKKRREERNILLYGKFLSEAPKTMYS